MVSAAHFARRLHTIVKRSLRAALDTVVTFAESEQAQRAASCLAPAAAIAELASSSISLRRLYAERVAQADCEAIAAMAGIINRSVATSEDALGFSTYSKEMCEVKFGQSQPLTEQDGSSLLLNLADSPMADLDSLFESSAEPDESDERSLDRSEGCDSNVGSESQPHFCTLREEMNSMRAFKACALNRASLLPDDMKRKLIVAASTYISEGADHVRYRLYVNFVREPAVLSGIGSG
jgi:hypothetical protein